jgi:hypothetical protein
MFADSEAPKLPIDQCLSRERSAFSPAGEKVAVRPDEAGPRRQRPKTAPSPRLSPPIFCKNAAVGHHAASAKKSGERGQHVMMKERFSGDQTCSPSARAEGGDVGRTNYYLYSEEAL